LALKYAALAIFLAIVATIAGVAGFDFGRDLAGRSQIIINLGPPPK
jgi:hypothetical protein